MRILITNDDGIDSPSLFELVKWAMKLGEVTVCAPRVQQSGSSHGIDFHRPIEIKPYPLIEGVESYSVDSTPADCVRFGTLGLKRDYDLVISGINKGLNMGEDIVYSGTVGAIFEAETRGQKGFAISTGFDSFDLAVENLDLIYKFIVDNKLFNFANIYNVNVPSDEIKGIRITRQGDAYFTDEFISLGNNMYQENGYCIHDNKHDLNVDTDATIDGYVTVTPITHKRTNNYAYEKLVLLNV